jgi:hypothetical protein
MGMVDDEDATAAGSFSISCATAKNHDQSITCAVICYLYESAGRIACAIAVRGSGDNAPAWGAQFDASLKPNG